MNNQNPNLFDVIANAGKTERRATVQPAALTSLLAPVAEYIVTTWEQRTGEQHDAGEVAVTIGRTVLGQAAAALADIAAEAAALAESLSPDAVEVIANADRSRVSLSVRVKTERGGAVVTLPYRAGNVLDGSSDVVGSALATLAPARVK